MDKPIGEAGEKGVEVELKEEKELRKRTPDSDSDSDELGGPKETAEVDLDM